MTQDEIIEMAQECGLVGMRPHLDGIYVESLLAFAKLVADKALAEHAMQEVQRLGQEIEQEPKIKTTDPFESSRVADYNRGWNDCLFASGIVKQPEQEPKIGCVNHDCDQCKAQRTEQEPVGVVHHKLTSTLGADYEQVAVFVRPVEQGTKLYTSPPQRKPLTGAQISAIGSKIFPSTWNIRHLEFARAIEAAHGIKENT